MTVEVRVLCALPMFGDLAEAELLEIAGCFAEAEIDTGELLYREGQAARAACFLIEGELEAVKALPGGGETLLGVIAPGALIGEMALVDSGTRTATVRARRPSRLLTVSFHFFHAAVDQLSAAAFKILRAISTTMTKRLDDLQGRIVEEWDCGTYRPRRADAGDGEPAAASLPRNFLPLLSVMPCFEGFKAAEIDALLERGRILEPARGDFLWREGDAADACCLVLRGAVERALMRDRRYQLAVLGPGRLVGGNALISGRAYGSDARCRSPSLLLALDRENFEALFHGTTPGCLKFQNLVSEDQLSQLKTADNLLAMLVSQRHVLRTPRSKTL